VSSTTSPCGPIPPAERWIVVVAAASLEGTRNQRESHRTKQEYDMSTTINRQKSVIAIVLALALGAILLLLSASAAHAGPGDGPGIDSPTAPPPQVQASENPVVFQGLQTTKQITVTWEAYKPAAVRVRAVGEPVNMFVFQPDDPPVMAINIFYGKTVQVYLETVPQPGMPTLVGPKLTITTVRVDVGTPAPQQPEINPTLIPIRPNLPHLPLGGTR
jgi:hypothetical protein